MNIDLNVLGYQDSIDINEIISYTKEYLGDSGIQKLDDVNVDGKIYIDYEENQIIELKVNGTMFIIDAITNLEVPYDFSIEIEENLEKSLKTLDLIEFLWHYIVLEIPIRFTLSNTNELKSKYKDIYFDEEEHITNNPFKDFFKE